MKHKRMYIFKNAIYQESGKSAKAVFSGPCELEIGPANEFGGKQETLNPEEMFVAAINSCIMITFFYFVRKSNIEVLSYYSDAQGQVEKQKDGFKFTKVEVRAKITLQQPDIAEKARELGKLAEKYCLVSRSLACPVQYSLVVQVKES